MLARMDPFRDLRTAEDEFDRLMGRAFSRDTWMPALDVRESDDRFDVKVDLPGLDPKDVNVTFEDGMLTVSGKRQFESEDTGETWHRVERGFGTFARSIRLPQTADTERIEASFEKGVLTVVVPKSEQAKPRTIQVKAEGS
ncbi:MAG TPA: Hsp20/alpha crystallin family protein [Actinomycetota bacterium]|nr:Hsp20/alpha crystallin family protein [Actinomycetota bacterium]